MNDTSNEYNCTLNLLYFAGFLIDFISGPVSVGFTSAAAIIIATTQIKDVLGLSFPGSKFLDVWEQLFEHISETWLWDTLLGFICMAVLLLLRVTTQYYLMQHKKHHVCLIWQPYHDVNLNQQCRWHYCRPAACCEEGTRFCFSDRSQYSRSLLWNLGVTSPLIKDGEWGGNIEYYGVMSGPQLAVCATGHSTQIYVNSTLICSDQRQDQKHIPHLCISVDIHTWISCIIYSDEN